MYQQIPYGPTPASAQLTAYLAQDFSPTRPLAGGKLHFYVTSFFSSLKVAPTIQLDGHEETLALRAFTEAYDASDVASETLLSRLDSGVDVTIVLNDVSYGRKSLTIKPIGFKVASAMFKACVANMQE
jgi:hypothetical protein